MTARGEVVAQILGVELLFDEPSWHHVRDWLRQRKRPVPESNRRQAMYPAGGDLLANAWGNGTRLRGDDSRCPLLRAAPACRARCARCSRSTSNRRSRRCPDLTPTTDLKLRVLGPSEAALGEKLAPFMAAGRNPAVGITASGGLLTVRIVATAGDRAAATGLCEATAQQLRPLLGDGLFAEGEGELPELVLQALRERGLTLAAAESCTGGKIAGAARRRRGRIRRLLRRRRRLQQREQDRAARCARRTHRGPRAPSARPVARAMAVAARERFGADLAVATTGIAGPAGGSAEKPVGTVCFALVGRDGERVWTSRIPDLGREFIRDRAVYEVVPRAHPVRRSCPVTDGYRL